MANSNSNSNHVENEISYFAAGPSKIPTEVLEDVRNETVHYGSTGVSFMEISHRSKDFELILREAEKHIKQILCVPDNFHILLIQGGGTGQMAAVPLNLAKSGGSADYFVTGSWSAKAAKECEKFCSVRRVWDRKQNEYYSVPQKGQFSINPEADFVYYCDNETIEGLEFAYVPEVPADIPLVCDMSSNILTRPIDFSKFGIVFAGAQKNLGCAGVTMVLVRDDLLARASIPRPAVLDYAAMAKAKNLLHTPPTAAIFVLGRVLRWVDHEGGMGVMTKRSALKSTSLYEFVAASEGFYHNDVPEHMRSRINVTFRVGGGDSDLEDKFVKEAAKEGLLALKGHRSVGGIRASLYNATSLHDVYRLTEFMKKFIKMHKK